jgi:hypothetical protein
MTEKIVDQESAVDMVIRRMKGYAEGLSHDVARGTKTPRLAALLLQQYGRGLEDATTVFLSNIRSSALIGRVVNKEVCKIDPEWGEHDRELWAGRPADVIAHKP